MLMRRIDELHLNYPFVGSRMLRDMLSHQGLEVGRRHVRTLMRRTSIEALYHKSNRVICRRTLVRICQTESECDWRYDCCRSPRKYGSSFYVLGTIHPQGSAKMPFSSGRALPP